jgi:hypothetical protein
MSPLDPTLENGPFVRIAPRRKGFDPQCFAPAPGFLSRRCVGGFVDPSDEHEPEG